MRTTLVALSILVASASAHADTKAWATAKKTLPAGQQMVVIANLGQIRDSQLFQTVWPKFLANHKDASDMLGKTKATCGFDAMGAIDSVVLSLPSVDGNSDDAAFVVSLKGVTEKEVDACITKLESGQTGKKVTISTADGITKYETGGDTLYMHWTDKSTLVFSASGKDNLVKMSKGGLAGDSALAPAFKGMKDAALTVIYGKAIPLDQVAPGASAKLMYMSANVKSGNLAADIHLVLDSAKTATDFAGKMNAQLADAKKNGGLPPMFTTLVNSIVVKASGAEVVLSANAPEKDLMGLLALAGISP